MTERPIWQEFDPSTFTHIARNDIVFNWAIDFRREGKYPKAETIWLLGSGVVEPFTIAALPGMEKSTVIAVDINPDLVAMAEDLKKGSAILWDEIGKKSLNPGRPNNDFSDRGRLERYFSVLSQLRSLGNLGAGFNLDQMQVSPTVAARVVFIQKDALSFLQETEGAGPDIIGDFFLQLNINKHVEGPNYSRAMIGEALQKLHQNGFYIIGDTGRNLPKTLASLAENDLHGRLNIASMVHAVNFGTGFTTSHYLVSSKYESLTGSQTVYQRVNERMEGRIFQAFSPITEQTDVASLSEITTKRINLVYLSDDGSSLNEPVAWNSKLSQSEVFPKVVPEKGDEFSENTGLIPAQKPYLTKG